MGDAIVHFNPATFFDWTVFISNGLIIVSEKGFLLESTG